MPIEVKTGKTAHIHIIVPDREPVSGEDIPAGCFCVQSGNGAGFIYEGHVYYRANTGFIDLMDPGSRWLAGTDTKFIVLRPSEAFSVVVR